MESMLSYHRYDIELKERAPLSVVRGGRYIFTALLKVNNLKEKIALVTSVSAPIPLASSLCLSHRCNDIFFVALPLPPNFSICYGKIRDPWINM